jgi:hypothetical protein
MANEDRQDSSGGCRLRNCTVLLGQWPIVGQCLDQADELALQRLPVRAFGFAFQIALPSLVPDMMPAKRATSASG